MIEGNKVPFSVTGTADNATLTLTQAAAARRAHYVTSIHLSFLSAVIKLGTLKDGTTVVANFHVHNQRDIVFPMPVKITEGAAAVVELAASGAGGNIAAGTMVGFSVGPGV